MTQIAIRSPLRLTRPPCIPRGQDEVTLGLESWDSLWNREELVPPWGCNSGLLQDCMTPQDPQKYEGPGQVLFWRGIWGTFLHLGHETWEGEPMGVSYLLVGF